MLDPHILLLIKANLKQLKLPTMLGDIGRAKEAHEEHLHVLAAIRAKNPEQAEAAARLHLRSAQRHRLSWLLRNETPPEGSMS